MGLVKLSPENIYLKTCSPSSSQSTEYLFPNLYPELRSRGVEGQQLQQFII